MKKLFLSGVSVTACVLAVVSIASATDLDLPRFRGGFRTWDQGILSDDILPSCLVAFFCSAPGGAILPSRPARECGRRAQRRSRTAPLRGRPKGLSLYEAVEVKRLFDPFSTSFIPVSLFDLESRFFAPTRT